MSKYQGSAFAMLHAIKLLPVESWSPSELRELLQIESWQFYPSWVWLQQRGYVEPVGQMRRGAGVKWKLTEAGHA